MAVLTIHQKPQTKKGKVRVEIDIDQWERLADILGFYRPEFITTLKQSLRESKRGKVRRVESLREIIS